MLKFNHKEEKYWTALGIDNDYANEMALRITEFVKLFMEQESFRESFNGTPNSYQTWFLLTEVMEFTEADMQDGMKLFMAGHLLGGFMMIQKQYLEGLIDSKKEILEQKLKDKLKDLEDF
jgi:hypothetical protein